MTRMPPMLNLIKTLIFRAIFGKFVNFGLDPHISDVKASPFISIGADLFCIFETHGIQIKEKITKLCLTFWQSTGLKQNKQAGLRNRYNALTSCNSTDTGCFPLNSIIYTSDWHYIACLKCIEAIVAFLHFVNKTILDKIE